MSNRTSINYRIISTGGRLEDNKNTMGDEGGTMMGIGGAAAASSASAGGSTVFVAGGGGMAGDATPTSFDQQDSATSAMDGIEWDDESVRDSLCFCKLNGERERD